MMSFMPLFCPNGNSARPPAGLGDRRVGRAKSTNLRPSPWLASYRFLAATERVQRTMFKRGRMPHAQPGDRWPARGQPRSRLQPSRDARAREQKPRPREPIPLPKRPRSARHTTPHRASHPKQQETIGEATYKDDLTLCSLKSELFKETAP